MASKRKTRPAEKGGSEEFAAWKGRPARAVLARLREVSVRLRISELDTHSDKNINGKIRTIDSVHT